MPLKNKDSIIIMAWPDTLARQVDMWYDLPLRLVGINKHRYYKAGHAAAVLVDHRTGELHYFDFGRYHLPTKYGRVRDAISDPDLKISTHATFDHKGDISNLKPLLVSFATREAFHGDGILYASVYKGISIQQAYQYAKKRQEDKVHYGPFDVRGTNCSRFIASLSKAGKPDWWTRIRLSLPLSLTPTPKGNVVVAAQHRQYYTVENNICTKHSPALWRQVSSYAFPSMKLSTNN